MPRRAMLLILVAPAVCGVAAAFHPGVSFLTPLARKGKEAILAGSYTVDPGHTSFGVEVEHLGVSRVQGRFTDVSGLLVLDPKRLGQSSISLRVGAASIDTGVPARDTHLRAKAFFDTAIHPEILFVSKHVWKSGRGYITEGDLTIRGITKEVRILFNMGGTEAGAPGGTRVGIVTKPLKIDRRDFGLPYDVKLPTGTPVVGYEVDVRLSLEAIRQS